MLFEENSFEEIWMNNFSSEEIRAKKIRVNEFERRKFQWKKNSPGRKLEGMYSNEEISMKKKPFPSKRSQNWTLKNY